MPLTLVGMGLWDEKDVSLRGLEAARAADVVFAEWYTAFLGGASKDRLEAAVGKPVAILSRADVEDASRILEAAREREVVLLVAGDSLTATTHVDLRLRCRKEGVPVRVVHGASVATAVPGLLGLANYKFGRSTTVVFPEGRFFPTSPYDVVKENLARGLHTLVLLDLRADEPRPERRGKPTAEPAVQPHPGIRCMTAAEGARLLLRMEEERAEGVLSPETPACVVARAGSPAPLVVRGPLRRIGEEDFGPPLHTLVVPGDLHFVESEAVDAFATPLSQPI